MKPKIATKTFERSPVPRAITAMKNRISTICAVLILSNYANLLRGSKD